MPTNINRLINWLDLQLTRRRYLLWSYTAIVTDDQHPAPAEVVLRFWAPSPEAVSEYLDDRLHFLRYRADITRGRKPFTKRSAQPPIVLNHSGHPRINRAWESNTVIECGPPAVASPIQLHCK